MAFDPVTAIIDAAKLVFDRIIPDKNQAAKAAAEFATEARKENFLASIGQIEINKEEAKHPRLFVSGWRPFVGWVCGFALAYHYIVQPLLSFLIINVFSDNVVLPAFDMYTLITVLMGLLGLGGLRSIEKVKGVANQ